MAVLEQVQSKINQEGVESQQLNFAQLNIGRFTPEIKKTIEQCTKLQILLLSECNLTSLDNLPDLDIVAIDLTKNNLSDSQLQKLTKYKNLSQIILNENKIKRLDGIKTLAHLESLEQIDFTDNPITEIDNYREKIYQILPKLQILDRFNRKGEEELSEQYEDENDDEEEGENDEDQVDDQQNGQEDEDDYEEDQDDEDDEDEFDEEEENMSQEKPVKKRKG